ncbi:hypothetical protein [Thalassospira xiamenensis]|uniref:Uncharacterized protein n=1 Tax=Thalassospira xiamenensis TaxID=220697 RepID=A0A285TYJ3_9PROT|nr:hypothetical protein [Thalassospira xiamenensis]SOC30941.1 hypothetical protein SAMN05428964_11124 [Thalassospira xiamenensis]
MKDTSDPIQSIYLTETSTDILKEHCIGRSFPDSVLAPKATSTITGEVISRAVSMAMKESGQSREEIAVAMSEYLVTEVVNRNMLNAYASEARKEHKIGLERFIALIASTKDERLVQLLADLVGMVLIPSSLLPAVEVVLWDAKKLLAQDQQQQAHEKLENALASQDLK